MADYSTDLVPESTPLPNPDPGNRAHGLLKFGDNLFSPNRAFKLAVEGNVVALYVIDDSDLPPDTAQGQYRQVIFTFGGNYGFDSCVMQDDGNLVIAFNGQAIWASATFGNPGAFLRCQDDGNLVIYSYGGAVLWHSNTYAGPR